MTAYLIATIEVHHAANYETYKSTAPALIEKHGGRYIVRGGARDLVEGSWPEGRIVVLEFPNWDSANTSRSPPSVMPTPRPISGLSKAGKPAPAPTACMPMWLARSR